MFVCYVQHEGNKKKYLFSCDFQPLEKIKPGVKVICDTKRGKSTAIALTNPIQLVASTEADFKYVLARMGATLPLKEVLSLTPEKPKLKPCPFCGEVQYLDVLDGNQVELRSEGDSDWSNAPFYTVICCSQIGGCGSACGYQQTPEKAIEVWNRRPEARNLRRKLNE